MARRQCPRGGWYWFLNKCLENMTNEIVVNFSSLTEPPSGGQKVSAFFTHSFCDHATKIERAPLCTKHIVMSPFTAPWKRTPNFWTRGGDRMFRR